jgi:hypothetical protein
MVSKAAKESLHGFTKTRSHSQLSLSKTILRAPIPRLYKSQSYDCAKIVFLYILEVTLSIDSCCEYIQKRDIRLKFDVKCVKLYKQPFHEKTRK